MPYIYGMAHARAKEKPPTDHCAMTLTHRFFFHQKWASSIVKYASTIRRARSLARSLARSKVYPSFRSLLTIKVGPFTHTDRRPMKFTIFILTKNTNFFKK